MSSILNETKIQLGIMEEDTAFDESIIMFINVAIDTLYQVGVGDGSFRINGIGDTWDSYLPEQEGSEMVKNYIFLKVKQLFDPPSSSIIMSCMDAQLKEMEWRISISRKEE